MAYFKGILVVMLSALSVCGLELVPYAPVRAEPVLEPWRWREMTALSGHGVLCVDEAADGTLWFGGVGGMLRYDGVCAEWITFDNKLKAAIGFDPNRSPWCRGILSLPDGTLLTAVESTLLHWKAGEWSVVLDGIGAVEYNTRLLRNGDGSVWVHSSDGLLRLHQDLTEHVRIISARDGEHSVGFCIDGSGHAWVVMNRPQDRAELINIPLENGIPADENEWRRFALPGGGYIREASLCEGAHGHIWYADSRGGITVRSLDPRTGSWTILEEPDANKQHFSLFKDSQGTVWAGGAGSLLAVRNDTCRYFSSTRLGLPSVPIAVFEAKNGWWWVILRGGHVYRMDPGDDQWLTYLNLRFECESSDGVQWFALEGSRVVAFQPADGRWVEHTREEGLIDGVRAMHASRHGFVWAVGSHKGRAAFSVYDGRRWTVFRHPEFARQIGEGAVFEASDGTMWFGATGDKLSDAPDAGGVLHYAVNAGMPRLLKHHHPPQLPYAVARLAQTTDGSIWLGSPQLFRFRAGADDPIVMIPDMPSVYTYDMVTDTAGALWIAKGMFGVYHASGGGWRQYTESSGLSGKFFVSLLPLQDGTVLAASERGISRFDGESWAGAVLPEEFGMSSRDSFMRRSRDGSVWFNYSRRDSRSPRIAMNLDADAGFCTIRYRADTLPPRTFIDEYLDHVDSSGNVHISWSGVDPWENTHAHTLHYSWRLNGGAWSPFSRSTKRTFLGLESGDYIFEVRARDRDFNIDATPVRCSFTVALPIWRRLWFICLVSLLVAGVVAMIRMRIYYHDRRLEDRTRHLEEIDRMKTGFFTNISHELNTPLHVLKGALHRLTRQSGGDDGERLLAMAGRSVDRMTLLVAQLLDFHKIEQGRMQIEPVETDIAALVQECVELLRPLAKARNVSVAYRCNPPFRGWVDVEKLRMIVSNLAGNAIKYTADGGSVRILLESRDHDPPGRVLQLIVEDTGRGVNRDDLPHIFERFYRSPEKKIIDGSGIGLNLTKELVELWGGEIQAESPIHPDPAGPGTRFTVILPITR